MSTIGNAESYIEIKGSLSIPDMITGKSAYEIAVINGFDGTEEEWLESLTEHTKLNAEEVIEEADKQIERMNETANTAKSNIATAENNAVSHIEQLAEEYNEIVQSTGDIETAVMSQKAVTKALDFTSRINLFDKNDERIIKDSFIGGPGDIYNLAGYYITHPIKVQAGKVYKLLHCKGLGVNVASQVVSENGDYIERNSGTLSEDNRYITHTFKTDCFARFNIGQTISLEDFMVAEEDKYPDTYIPFGVKVTGWNIGNNADLNTDNKSSLVDAINEVNTKAKSTLNHLVGKKLSVNGDSICAGAGYTGGYAKIIGENNSMTIQNIGVGGGTITADTYIGDNARHWICRTIERMDTDADYAIVEGGVNDASLSVPLGEITPNFKSALDDTTFYGAFESMLKQLIVRFAGKKYGYIAVHQMVANYRASDNPETSYYWAAKKCCEKWGVPFLDLNISVPPFAIFKYSSSTPSELIALTDTYTHNGDGWHPNEEGYKKYYVPKIEAWLKTL